MTYFKPVRNHPVAKFFYKGTHTHPIRRTVLVVESNPRFIKGYELREGNVTRQLKDAPLMVYSRRKIARDRQVSHRRKHGYETSTLRRYDLYEILKGV